MFTALTLHNSTHGHYDEGVSSLVDTWMLVRDIEFNGERNRGLYIMKSRGMKNSNQVREFIISDKGIRLVDVFLGPEGVLTGSAREAYRLKEATKEVLKDYALSRKDKEIERKKSILNSKISNLTAEFESIKDELNNIYLEDQLKEEIEQKNRTKLVALRANKNEKNGKGKSK